MKTKTLIALIGLFTLFSCTQNRDVNDILENENTRNEIFSAIADNPEYRASFRNYMQEHNNGGNMMMNGNMNGMNHSGRMMNMQDSTAMMQSFMNNHRMMSNMVQMMHTRGMMSDECMDQAMNKMNENMQNKNMQKEN